MTARSRLAGAADQRVRSSHPLARGRFERITARVAHEFARRREAEGRLAAHRDSPSRHPSNRQEENRWA
jgi:hypothetical protein